MIPPDSRDDAWRVPGGFRLSVDPRLNWLLREAQCGRANSVVTNVVSNRDAPIRVSRGVRHGVEFSALMRTLHDEPDCRAARLASARNHELQLAVFPILLMTAIKLKRGKPVRPCAGSSACIGRFAAWNEELCIADKIRN